MIDLEIPGYGQLTLSHLVLDFNGTLACDGRMLDDVRSRLEGVAQHLTVHVVTGNTFGTAAAELGDLPLQLTLLDGRELLGAQSEEKRRYVEALGAERTVAIGNGRNDRAMLAAAALGVAVGQEEGVAVAALSAADMFVPDVRDALDLLLKPSRLLAGLRG